MRSPLVKQIRSILARLQEIERRQIGAAWNGKVAQVDSQKGLIRTVLGKDENGNPVLSAWVPQQQIAGALKVHSLPSVGQTVRLHSVDGDIEQAVAVPFNWNKDNPDPSQSADDHVLTLGDVTVTLQGGGVTISVGGVTLQITGSGVDITGGQVTHDSKNIGSTHKHTGVVPGGALTGNPS